MNFLSFHNKTKNMLNLFSNEKNSMKKTVFFTFYVPHNETSISAALSSRYVAHKTELSHLVDGKMEMDQNCFRLSHTHI